VARQNTSPTSDPGRYLRAVCVGLGGLICAPAWALAPLEIPEAEEAESWVNAAALAGLELGHADGGPSVSLEVRAGAWLMIVRDTQGITREVAVSPPGDHAAREELLFLAASLLHPIETGELLVKPPLEQPDPPDPPERAQLPVASFLTLPEAVPSVARSAPAVVASRGGPSVTAAVPASVVSSSTGEPANRRRLAVGPSVRVDGNTAPAVGVTVSGGVTRASHLRLGGLIEVRSPGVIRPLSPSDQLASSGLFAAPGAQGAGRWAPYADALLGASLRRYYDSGGLVGAVTSTAVGLQLGATLPIEAMRIELFGRGAADLRSVEILHDDGSVMQSGLSACAGLMVAWEGLNSFDDANFMDE